MKFAFTALSLVALASTLHADPIRLRAGSMAFPDPPLGGPVHLEGSRGFSFEGWSGFGRLDFMDCYYGCDAGESVSIGLSINGNDLPGVVELDGFDYPDCGGMDSWDQLEIEIDGKLRIPRLGDKETKVVSTRGTLTGSFTHTQVPLATVTETLSGKVRATVQLEKYDGLWTVESVTYNVIR